MASENSGRELRFLAGLQCFDAAAKTATFYLMNTSKNMNGWGVTAKALDEALPSILGKPIGMGVGYKIDRHYPDGQTMDSGAFVTYENKGNYATATAKISDAKTLALLQEKKLGPTSVVIRAFDVVCSKCGQGLPASSDPREHSCIKDGSGYEQIHSYSYKRVDFVDVPAYPQAGLLELASRAESRGHVIELLAGVYESQAPPSGVTKLEEEKNLPEEKEFEKKMANLEQNLQKAEQEREAAKAEAAESKKTMETMQAQLDAIKQEKHDGLVVDCYQARAKAGIAGKDDEEKKMLAKLTDDVLAILKADALKVASIPHESPGPKARYNKQEGDQLLAAVNERRDAEGLPLLKELF